MFKFKFRVVVMVTVMVVTRVKALVEVMFKIEAGQTKVVIAIKVIGEVVVKFVFNI